MTEVGRVSGLVRYPVKSMAGIATKSASLGWHGLDGDRRFGFRRSGDERGFPWLTASRVPRLLLYDPVCRDESAGEPLPTHVRTPTGKELDLWSHELADEIADRWGGRVELTKFEQGIFDDAPISIMSFATVAGICSDAGVDVDPRRFRANIIIDTAGDAPFLEDDWVGETLVFGTVEPRPAVKVTARDVRCMMINLDPDTGEQDARVMKSVVRLNTNHAGVYGTVVGEGAMRVGDVVSLETDARR